jgi:hypothetical protein
MSCACIVAAQSGSPQVTMNRNSFIDDIYLSEKIFDVAKLVCFFVVLSIDLLIFQSTDVDF